MEVLDVLVLVHDVAIAPHKPARRQQAVNPHRPPGVNSARAYANLHGNGTNKAVETRRNVRQSACHSISSHILTRIMACCLTMILLLPRTKALACWLASKVVTKVLVNFHLLRNQIEIIQRKFYHWPRHALPWPGERGEEKSWEKSAQLTSAPRPNRNPSENRVDAL